MVTLVLMSISVFGLAQAEGSGSKTKDVKGTVVGKVEIRTERDLGRPVEAVYIRVFLAQDESGKSMDALLGSTLKVVGSKSDNIAKFSGKDIRVAGKIRGGKEILVDTITTPKTASDGSESKTAGKTVSKKRTSSAGEGSDKK